MRFDNLADWLRWQETLHPRRIDLRLERVGGVWARLGPRTFPAPVITVGGTNGKGSCVAYLDAWFRAAGYRSCAYTSPHLLRYNERVRIHGVDATDEALCESFARIDAVRGNAALTYFELGTLAALDLFVRSKPDVVILEVGLGGRLDAVNILDPDVALVTSIGRDHTAWLGDEPDQIAFEKAGIFRADRPAVIGSRQVPPRLRGRAEELGARVLQLGSEFDWRVDGAGEVGGNGGAWSWNGPDGALRSALPAPALRGQFQYDNAAAALCAAECLAHRLPLPNAAVRQGLHRVRLEGRFSVLPGPVTRILDVAHNVEAARALASNLARLRCEGTRHAVFSLLADKDAVGIVAVLAPLIDQWHLAEAPGDRATPLARLLEAVGSSAPARAPVTYASLGQACAGALDAARPGDCLLVFGSFVTVEAALRNPGFAPV